MWIFPLLFILGLAIAAPTLTSPTVEDTTNNIKYHGVASNGVEQFLNIRFGKETSGQRRFAPPEAFSYARGSHVNATAVGAACPQNPNPPPPLTGDLALSEDCLSLRVARPANTKPGDKLPVMVWIYGGSDEMGQAYDRVYNPTALVRGAVQKRMPVIYVAMNYRLNIFGFAHTQALADSQSLNPGLLDQRLALEWVQENIAYFGGDASSVTIFGESDGATGVGLQLTAYGGQGDAPFHRAIMESGAPTADSGVSGPGTEQATESVVALTTCASAQATPEQTIECLRNLPMQTLLTAWLQYRESVNPMWTGDVFYPTVDGSFIPKPPSALLLNGEFHQNIDIIAGWNANDGSIFTPKDLNTTSDTRTFVQTNFPGLSNAATGTILSLYPGSDYQDISRETGVSVESFRAATIFRDINFACPAILVAGAVTAHGGKAYLYEFNQTISEDGLATPSFEGVYHSSEIPFVFNDASQYVNASIVKQVQSEMSGSWAYFARSGKPSSSVRGATLSGWEPALRNSSGSLGAPGSLNVQIIGGAYSGLNVVNARSRVEPSLLRRCAFINDPAILGDLQT